MSKLTEEMIKEELVKCQAYEIELQADPWFLERPPHVQALMKKFPQWGFYQYKDSKAPVRIWGVAELIDHDEKGDSKLVFHASCAHLMWTNETIGGIPPNMLERVDRWSENHLSIIHTNHPKIIDCFIHPFGFAGFINRDQSG